MSANSHNIAVRFRAMNYRVTEYKRRIVIELRNADVSKRDVLDQLYSEDWPIIAIVVTNKHQAEDDFNSVTIWLHEEV